MTVVPFDREEALILVEVRLWGPLGDADLIFALDTGACVTLVTAEALDKLGYNPKDGVAITSITTAIGQEPGYILRVRELRALGHSFSDVPVHAHDLADASGIDDLLGLDFLTHFNYEIRSKDGLIRIEQA